MLDAASDEALDGLPFGVVRMNRAYEVTLYNRYEAGLSGLSARQSLGRHFFREIAPCTNNELVARKYDVGGPLDEVVDYVFTYKLSPTPVRLRLLRGEHAETCYLLVEVV